MNCPETFYMEVVVCFVHEETRKYISTIEGTSSTNCTIIHIFGYLFVGLSVSSPVDKCDNEAWQRTDNEPIACEQKVSETDKNFAMLAQEG